MPSSSMAFRVKSMCKRTASKDWGSFVPRAPTPVSRSQVFKRIMHRRSWPSCANDSASSSTISKPVPTRPSSNSSKPNMVDNGSANHTSCVRSRQMSAWRHSVFNPRNSRNPAPSKSNCNVAAALWDTVSASRCNACNLPKERQRSASDSPPPPLPPPPWRGRKAGLETGAPGSTAPLGTAEDARARFRSRGGISSWNLLSLSLFTRRGRKCPSLAFFRFSNFRSSTSVIMTMRKNSSNTRTRARPIRDP
mmetsp:Transcript_111200/g.346595  ORF Transcript_111200/g.346595 Transcript_111200/m.346595 type:complete len:250 (+) Transcript_111200:907-1656(+)